MRLRGGALPMCAEQPAGTPCWWRCGAFVTAFDRLTPEKRELAAAVRGRGAPGIDKIAAAIAVALDRDPGELDVQLFAGVVVGARLAAQAVVGREPGRNHVDTLDTALGRLAVGVPLADEPLPPTPARSLLTG